MTLGKAAALAASFLDPALAESIPREYEWDPTALAWGPPEDDEQEL